MIWLALIGFMVLGLGLISYTYYVERKRILKDRQDVAKVMKEFADRVKKENGEN